MIQAWIILLIWIEIYSIGITILAKRNKTPYYAIYLIPFVSLFYVDKFTGGFKVMTIPVKKWGETILIFLVIVILSQIGCQWAITTLSAEMAGYFVQIMLLPICTCGLLYWFGTIASTLKMLNILGLDFKGAIFLVALMFPIPILLLRKSDEEKRKE